MENTAELYYSQLGNTVNPGPILAALYGKLYSYETTRSEIIMMNKLVGIFGRFTVFSSIIKMVGSYPERPAEPYPLLHAICANKFEQEHKGVLFQAHDSLDRYINALEKEIDSVKKAKGKIPTSEGL